MQLIMQKKHLPAIVLCLAVGLMTIGCSPQKPTASQQGDKAGAEKEKIDPYLPAESVDKAGKVKQFTEEQLEKMAKTPLDRDLFILYIEKEWPVEKLSEYTGKYDPAELLDESPVSDTSGLGEMTVHKGKEQGFDSITVVVAEDNGKNKTYEGEGIKGWKRWSYALTLTRGDDRWFIAATLPNDFMDQSKKYVPAKEEKKD